ncbi:MAG: alpha/beta fold hydrolase [Candidatus Dependentiae bacterium]|nr:alpha/beta fold hydrolase [Candidatus Dependentiae bacterium]
MFWLLKSALYLAGSGITLTTGLAAYLAFFQSPFYFPQPTGKYAVGIQTYHWIDEQRKALMGDAVQKKELMVSVWYPSAEDKAAQKPIAPYIPYFIDYCKKHQKLAWLLALSRPMYTYEVPDAKLSDHKPQLPVIIFSHGMGGTRDMNGAHCQELASQGYLVIGISHNYGCGVVQFPDGRIQESAQATYATLQQSKNPCDGIKFSNDNIGICIDDVQMALDHIARLSVDKTSLFYNRIDMNAIGMFGHSYGGAVTTQLCRIDSRIKAGVSLDGSPLGVNPIEPFNKPFMFLLAEPVSLETMKKLAKQSGMQDEYIDSFCTTMHQSHVPAIDKLVKAIGHDAYKIIIPNTEHTSFTDMALIKESCLLARPLNNLGAGTGNGYQTTMLINSYLVSFFDTYLKGIPSELFKNSRQDCREASDTVVQAKSLTRPQEPQLPYPYRQEQVSYTTNAGDITISGTLTLPDTQNRLCPAVLLIAGSGPQDRNESVCGHKPFLVIADYLTRQGIAVLRVDKRGVGESTGNYDTATTADFAADVHAGIQYLVNRTEINSHQIGLIGHSEGGLIAPLVATQSKNVAFIILLAAPGVNGEEIACEQQALMQRAAGVAEEAIARSCALQKRLFTILKADISPEVRDQQLRQELLQDLASLPETQQKSHDENMAKVEAIIKGSITNWVRYFISYEPTVALKQVKIPVLVVMGECDLQVSPKQNTPAIMQALKESGNHDYTIVELPQLNHLLQTCKTGAVAEYAIIEETIAPIALDTMCQWILARITKNS